MEIKLVYLNALEKAREELKYWKDTYKMHPNSCRLCGLELDPDTNKIINEEYHETCLLEMDKHREYQINFCRTHTYNEVLEGGLICSLNKDKSEIFCRQLKEMMYENSLKKRKTPFILNMTIVDELQKVCLASPTFIKAWNYIKKSLVIPTYLINKKELEDKWRTIFNRRIYSHEGFRCSKVSNKKFRCPRTKEGHKTVGRLKCRDCEHLNLIPPKRYRKARGR